MLPVDRIRFHIIEARKQDVATLRDALLADQMVDALLEDRRNTGAATEQALIQRFGFTSDEITRLRTRAVDAATSRFIDRNMVDPIAA